jgi:hypothetical protein
MKKENEKLNPLTCELQVGDVVEVISSEGKHIAEIFKITGVIYACFCLKANSGCVTWAHRHELRLISRNGQPVEQVEAEQWQPKSGEKVWNTVIKQVNVIFEFEGDWYVHGKRPNSGENLTQKIEERHFKSLEPYTGQDKPKIDFGKAGVILTDGEIVVVTTGEMKGNTFRAKILGGFDDAFIALDTWRDITAEATPILEQIKKLME